MVFTVRGYRPEDYSMIASWWEHSDMAIPPADAIPMESTIIAEVDGNAVIACSLVFTNVKAYCYMDFLVGNPSFKGPERKQATSLVVSCLENLAKAEGYRAILCFSTKSPLTKYYESLGYRPTYSNITSHMRNL